MAQAAKAIASLRQALADERLARLVSVIVDRLHPEEIWLFGSRARGDARTRQRLRSVRRRPGRYAAGEDWAREHARDREESVGMRRTCWPVVAHVFAHERDLIGTLSYTVAREGRDPLRQRSGFVERETGRRHRRGDSGGGP